MSEDGPELILIAGVEGGGISLYRERRSDGTWRFNVRYTDQTAMFLGEPASETKSSWAESWDDAIKDLDARKWLSLPGVFVHPEFRQAVWEAVSTRLERRTDAHAARALGRWRSRCGM